MLCFKLVNKKCIAVASAISFVVSLFIVYTFNSTLKNNFRFIAQTMEAISAPKLELIGDLRNSTKTFIPTKNMTTINKVSVSVSKEEQLPTISGRKKLLLFVGIHTAPTRVDRRKAVRETWMTECQSNSNSVCRFFTDGQDAKGHRLEGEKRYPLENESRVYGDMLLIDAPGGINFAVKLLWMFQWAKEKYDFQYFLRLDDDYFICFNKLLLELFHRPRQKFQWGWLHCELEAATWLDEAFHLFSVDLVESFLSRRDSLVCHVWESQAIGYWLKNIPDVTTFSDNERILHHQSGFSSEKHVVERIEICQSVLAIHKSYPEKMRLFWSVYQKEDKNISYYVPPVVYNCRFKLAMNYMVWAKKPIWFSEPKLCKDNPIWDREGEYKGRRGY